VTLVGLVDTVVWTDDKSIYLFTDGTGPFIQIWHLYDEGEDVVEHMLSVSARAVSTTGLMCDEALEHTFV
jgi:hypothetical protein